MNKIKIEKKNGKIKTKIINTTKEKKIENKIKAIITFDFLKENPLPERKAKEIQRLINCIFTSYKENHQSDIIIEIYTQLLDVKTKSELEKLFFYSIRSYYKKTNKITGAEYNILLKSYEKEKDNTLNIFAKTAIKQYYMLLTYKMSLERIKKYYTISKNSQNNIIDLLKINFPEEKSNIYELSNYELKKELEAAYIKRKKHLCFGCPVPILECPKMLDEELRHIENYDFITEGEQIYDQNGELESFKVTRCLKLERKQRLLKK